MTGQRSSQIIALVTESLGDEYEVDILRGASAAARSASARVLYVAAGAVGDPNPDRSAQNFAFDLIGPHNVGGVLVVASVLAGSVGVEGLRTWLGRYAGLPLGSIGIPLEGMPSVEVDNTAGAHEAVRHLIQVHGARRIAYIRGPHGSAEADLRLRAYEQALGEGDLELDPNLVVDGDFTRSGGTKAMRQLLDDRKVRPSLLDAVVTANDYMALAALDELARRGVQVPEEVAVVGFDDIDSARLAQPPLTTVRQPIQLLGRRGAEMLLDCIEGRKTSSEHLATELKVRGSCGCSTADLTSSIGDSAVYRGSASFHQRRPLLLAEVARAAQGRFGLAGSGWEARLLDALLAEVRDSRSASFNRAVEQLMRSLEFTREDAVIVQAVLTALRRHTLAYAADDAAMRDRLEGAIHGARIFTNSLGGELEAARVSQVDSKLRALHVELLSAAFEGYDALSGVAARLLPDLHVETGMLAALAAPDDVERDATVLFSFGAMGRDAPLRAVSLRHIVKLAIEESSSRTLVLAPIVFRSQAVGVMILGLAAIRSGVMEELRDACTTVLVVTRLARQAAL